MSQDWTPPATDTPAKQETTGGWKPPASDTEVTPKKAGGASSPPTSLLSQIGGRNSQKLPNPTPPPTQQANPVQQQALQRLSDLANTQQHIGKLKEQMYPENLSTDVKKMYDAMPKEQKRDFLKSPQFNITDMQSLKNMTPDDMKHWQYMNETNTGKALGFVANTGREATKGSLDVLKGISHLMKPLSGQAGQMSADLLFDEADKHTNMGLTEGDIKQAENSPIENAVGQIAYVAPALLGGEATGSSKAIFALQGIGQGKNMIENTNASPTAKALFPLATGMVNGVLMGDAGEGILAKLPSSLRSDITNKVALDAVKDAAGKEITPDMLKQEAVNFTQRVKNGGIAYLKNFAHTSADLSALNAANWALQKGVNASEGKQIFQTGDFPEQIGNAVEQAAVLSTPALTHLLPYSEAKDQVTNRILENSNSAEQIKGELQQHGQQNGWSPEETQATLDHVDKIANVAKQIPDNLPIPKRNQSVELVMGRHDLEGQLKQEQEQRKQLDPALQDIPSPHEQLLTDKIEQANDKLRDIATGNKTTYSKGVGEEDGTYYKTTNGVKEEIPQSRYELENLERTTKQQQNDEQTKTQEQTTQEENGQQGREVAERPVNATETGENTSKSEEKNDEGRNVGNGGAEPPPAKKRYTIKGEEVKPKEDQHTVIPVGTEESEKEKTTGIKKAISESTRVTKNLPEVKLNKLGSDAETLQKGKSMVDKGEIRPQELAKDIINKPRTYTEDEAAAMHYYAHQLRVHEENLRNALSETDEEDKPAIVSNLQQLDDQIDEKTKADRINSNQWGKLGNIMQIEADHSFSPAQVRTVIRENYGGEIPKDVKARLDKAEDERDKAIADLKKVTEQQIKKDGDELINKIAKRSIIRQSKEELQSEAKDLVQELKKAFKHDVSKVNSGVPIPTETLAVLGKLAVNYFKQGIKDFEGLVNKIHEELPNIDKKQLREYLSSYEPIREESRERRISLLGKKEKSLNKQLETGNITDRSHKPEITFRKNNEVIKAQQRVADAEYKIKQEKSKSYKASQTGLGRAANWFLRWQRRAILANPLTSLKLVSAAVSDVALRPQKEAVGELYSRLFKQLGEKAMLEGDGFNAKAEAAYWKELLNPKKALHNTAEIYKTGAGDLKKRFSEKQMEHFKGWDALQDTHQVIKDPILRANYEASMVKANNWAAKSGIDYTDPLVQRYLEHAAFGRAQYAIFQEDNPLGKKISNLLNNVDQSLIKDINSENVTSARKFIFKFLFPINLTPTNITSRVASHIFGLPRGLALTADMYRKGIENFTPEQADFVMRQLKNGSVGMAYFATGMFLANKYLGGLYQKDDKDKKFQSSPRMDEMKINGVNIDKRLQHGMIPYLLQGGATYDRVYNHYYSKDKDDGKLLDFLESNANAAGATGGSIAEGLPIMNVPYHALGAVFEPYMRKQFAKDLIPYPIKQASDAIGLTQAKKDKKPVNKMTIKQ